MHLAMRPTPCTTGQVHLLVYYIKLKSRPSVCLHSFLVRLLTLLSLRRSTSDLLDAIAMSSGISEFVFTSL